MNIKIVEVTKKQRQILDAWDRAADTNTHASSDRILAQVVSQTGASREEVAEVFRLCGRMPL